ncbi:MAG TPA: MFS transporter [Aeromonadales bacterium]|nr:MFS transporter [Aeromonadales bacterium]
MLICIFTGFTSGLPLYILIQLVPAWLRTEGVSLKEIGLFALIGFPYVWKFLWSPFMDRFTPPFLGRRRGWMLITQISLFISIIYMGQLNPTTSLWPIAYLAAAVAFFSASQDIVLDAYRRELLNDEQLGIGNSIHVQAYRIAGLVPGSLGLILADHFQWSTVFIFISAFMFVGILMTFFIKEANTTPRPPETLLLAVEEPFMEFHTRLGLEKMIIFVLFLILYKLGDNMATALQTPFYIDVGFSLTEIGIIAKFSSLASVIAGGLLAGIIMIKLSINRALWVFGFIQIMSILGFAFLNEIGPVEWVLAVVISFEYLGVGLGATALVAFMARETNPNYAATQLALFTAVAALPRTFANAITGYIVESVGWTQFFFICTALAIPGMLMLFKVAPWNGEGTLQNSGTSHQSSNS